MNISPEAREAAARVTDGGYMEIEAIRQGKRDHRDLVRAMQALIDQTIERCAVQAHEVGYGQAEGWQRNPGADDSGNIAASNATKWITLSIRSLKSNTDGGGDE